MILHLVHDEKIINRTIDLFESVFPKDNLFVVFTRKKFKFVREGENVIPYLAFEQKMNDLNITSVVIHYMNSRKMKFVRKFYPKDIPVYWIIWGADLYNKLLEPKGFEMIDKNSGYYRSGRIGKFFSIPYDKIREKIRAARNIKFINERINYIVTDTTENDYDMLMEYYPQLNHIPWRDFFYYPIDVVLGDELISKYIDGNNIQIGNSASHTNNHEYAMTILSGLDIAGRKVVVPLSYSGKEGYIKSVTASGKKLLRDNFYPLTDFMPLADYNRLLTSVSVAIYGNWRQEAIGNILISLYLGAKVFLSYRNPVLRWARNHNLVVFELESITQKDIDEPLSADDIQHNRNILMELYNKNRLYTLIKDSFVDR
ncbi:hypothetical protein D0T84_18295 [Dysgonomonas sp. 521]|uniref:TDP-N-acetylfucosamine:lipid II N-acetylfucosaminyltransferase n=1 Tax=Dysgonomonas sp. 521 TaxID=2302932 RepID=UPI0013D5DD80|nr:TDP-N-acetylfucosamine:lipid II N-acetylfucosaminyltransferase [Dysgonomonas sp. 521]NDV96843.1 hypothetical protein [Dysgonomonas sp. 521]